MSIYIPGAGRQYQQIGFDEKHVERFTRDLHSSSDPKKALEDLAIEGNVVDPKDYESYWGCETIVKTESGKNIPQVMADLFNYIEQKRTDYAADMALIQDPKIESNRASVSLSVRLLLLNKK